MKLITIIALACLVLGQIGSPAFVQAQQAATQSLLAPQDTWFESTSTKNGRRRFLAIGNFFDTTNSAYYRDSKALLEFELPPLAGITVHRVELKVYKYANAASAAVPITLTSELSSQPVTTLADNGDYDFDELSFRIPGVPAQPQQRRVRFELQVPQAKSLEGIAVCSGLLTDNICKQQYHPRLLVSYSYNTKAKVSLLEIDEGNTYTWKTDLPLVKCSAHSGCRFNARVHIEDLEANAKWYLLAKTTAGDKLHTSSLAQLNRTNSVGIDLPDGSYTIGYQLTDGEFQEQVWLKQITINTVPPNSPVKPRLIEFKLDKGKISPANNDGVFDVARLSASFEASVASIHLEVRDSANKLVYRKAMKHQGKNATITFEGRDDKAKLLPDGTYKLNFSCTDQAGLGCEQHRPLNIVIDNTAPKLYL